MKKALLLFFWVANYIGLGHVAARFDLLSESQLALDAVDDYINTAFSLQKSVSIEDNLPQSYHQFIAEYKNREAQNYKNLARRSFQQRMDFICDEQNSMEDILGMLLRERLVNLSGRTDDLGLYFGRGQLDALFEPMSSSFFYNKLAGFCNESNSATKRFLLIQFEITERLICLAYRACDPTQITGNTLKSLQMSPQLWPRLANETLKPLCPDVCGGYAPLEKLWNLLPSERKNDGGNVPQVLSRYVWPAYTDPLKLREFFDKAAQAEYLAFRQTCDGEIYRAHMCPGLKVFPKSGILGANIKDVIVVRDIVEGEYWPPLEMPPFLQRQIDALSASAAENSLDLGTSFFSVNHVPKQAKKNKKKLATSDEKAGPVVEAQDDAVSLEQDLKDTEHEAAEGAGAGAASIHAAAFGDDDPVAELVVTTADASFVYPEGIRGKAVLDAPMPPLGAHHGIGKFLDTLFDSRRALSLTFADVERAWGRIGGRVEGKKNGGSHRVFIAPDGRKLWGSYDHGGFGPKTIKYIQALFYWAGAREGY